jgi:hypothetical protein
MSTNDKVGTTISGGGGVNLISADAFVEIPLAKNLELDISARRSVTDVIIHPLLVTITREVFKTLKLVPTVQIKNTNSDFYFYDYTAKLLFD